MGYLRTYLYAIIACVLFTFSLTTTAAPNPLGALPKAHLGDQAINHVSYVPRLFLGGYAGSGLVGRGDLLVPMYITNDKNFFAYGQGLYGAEKDEWLNNTWSGSFGMGYRQIANIGTHGNIFGAFVLADYGVTPDDHGVWLISPGIESLGEVFDFRANGYFPVSDHCWTTENWASDYGNYNHISFGPHTMYDVKFIYHEETGPGADAELGGRLFKVKGTLVKGYLNGYYYWMEHNDNVYGAGARVTIQPNTYLEFSLNYDYDKDRNSLFMAGARVSLYDLFNHKPKVIDEYNLQRRLYDPLERNFATLASGSSIVISDKGKPEITCSLAKYKNVWFFGGPKAGSQNGGNGTYDNPFTPDELNQGTLTTIVGKTTNGDVKDPDTGSKYDIITLALSGMDINGTPGAEVYDIGDFGVLNNNGGGLRLAYEAGDVWNNNWNMLGRTDGPNGFCRPALYGERPTLNGQMAVGGEAVGPAANNIPTYVSGTAMLQSLRLYYTPTLIPPPNALGVSAALIIGSPEGSSGSTVTLEHDDIEANYTMESAPQLSFLYAIAIFSTNTLNISSLTNGAEYGSTITATTNITPDYIPTYGFTNVGIFSFDGGIINITGNGNIVSSVINDPGARFDNRSGMGPVRPFMVYGIDMKKETVAGAVNINVENPTSTNPNVIEGIYNFIKAGENYQPVATDLTVMGIRVVGESTVEKTDASSAIIRAQINGSATIVSAFAAGIAQDPQELFQPAIKNNGVTGPVVPPTIDINNVTFDVSNAFYSFLSSSYGIYVRMSSEDIETRLIVTGSNFSGVSADDANAIIWGIYNLHGIKSSSPDDVARLLGGGNQFGSLTNEVGWVI